MKKHKGILADLGTDSRWTLFLDRDGVINRKIHNGYVLSVEQFEFIAGVLKAFPILNNHFGKIIIVTNQQCVGKDLISQDQLNTIHKYMVDAIEESGGKIDDIFVSTDLESDRGTNRKPGPGMALDAIKRYPSIELTKSIIAGDSITDMEFGRVTGMKRVLINTGEDYNRRHYDLRFNSLLEFAESL